MFDLSEDDSYGDPGDADAAAEPGRDPDDPPARHDIYLRGDGATADGDRPFLDRHDLVTGETTRLFAQPSRRARVRALLRRRPS